jgi:hypothetical protein
MKTPAHRTSSRPAPRRKAPTPATTPEPPPETASRVPPFELTEQAFRLDVTGTKDDLREELGEGYVQSMTSGQQAAEDLRDEAVAEENGGPFIVTTGATEFAFGTDGSNPAGAEPAAFPLVSAQPQGTTALAGELPARRKRTRR